MSAATSPETKTPSAGLGDRIRQFLDLIRFSHTVFALPFALLSATIAWFRPDTIFLWQDLVGILLCPFVVTAVVVLLAVEHQDHIGVLLDRT